MNVSSTFVGHCAVLLPIWLNEVFSVIFYLDRLCPTTNSVHILAWGHLELFLSDPGRLWVFPSSALLYTTSLYFKCLFLGNCCHCPLDTLLLALPNVLYTYCTLHESCIPANVCQTVSCQRTGAYLPPHLQELGIASCHSIQEELIKYLFNKFMNQRMSQYVNTLVLRKCSIFLICHVTAGESGKILVK